MTGQPLRDGQPLPALPRGQAAAAGGDGGLAGAGLGAGIGMAMGNAMAGALNPAAGNQSTGNQAAAPVAPQAPAASQAPAGGTVMVRCTQCNHLNAETAKFCSECGNKLFAD